jgi:Cu-Zn family superoxide dismutase
MTTQATAVAVLVAGMLFTGVANAAHAPVTVELKNAKGEKVGEAKLSATEGGVKVSLKASHLEPGKHGIHFHEKGSCVGPDFKSAGGHLNPEHKEHGLENPKGSHAGDLPNLDVSRSGTAHADFVAKGATLDEGADSLLRPEGAALVIHAKADDQKTNPTGNSGDRVACGVIAAPTAGQ